MTYKNTSKYNSKTTKSKYLETNQKSRSISEKSGEKSVDGFLDDNTLDIKNFFPTGFCDSISIHFYGLEI